MSIEGIIIGVCVVVWYVANQVIRTRKELEKKRKEFERCLRDKMEEAAEESRRHQRDLKKELDDLVVRIKGDWASSGRSNRMSISPDGGLRYNFINGDKVDLSGNKLKVELANNRTTYTLGLIVQMEFTMLLSFIANNSVGSQRNSNYGQRRYASETFVPDDPKMKRYYTLLETIKSREENLSKLKPSDPERPALENELKAAKGRAEQMKKSLNQK